MARPRVFSYTPEEMEALGKEMVQWCIENQPIHLSEWYTIHKKYTYNEWKNFIQLTEFLPYYEQALKIVGLQYMRKDSVIEPNIKNRWQRVYFADVREQEDADAEADALRKAKALKSEAQASAEYVKEVQAGISRGRKPIK